LIEIAGGIGDGIVVETADEIVDETETEILTDEIREIREIPETPTAEEMIVDLTSVVIAEGETDAQTSDKTVAETLLQSHRGYSHQRNYHRNKQRLSYAPSHVPSCPRSLLKPIPSIIANRATNPLLAQARTERSSREYTCIHNARLH
jgi:hypothetical protein